eukprot:Nk52_evm18s16 gene=Nk52_evmTU18s16
MSTLKECVKEKLLNEMIKKIQPASGWKVLIVDQHSMRIISSSCRMYDIMDEGVTLVEDIKNSRQPLPAFEAIYFITPAKASVERLIKDFENQYQPKYAAVHLFFTAMCPQTLFDMISTAPNLPARLKTFQEINIEFMPIESQVFSLDNPAAFHELYSPVPSNAGFELKKTADQLATLCATLGEYPTLRYQANSPKNAELARLVQDRLDEYKRTGNIVNSGKPRGTLLIVDRGFDCSSPLLHELTYQALAYDVLPIENDVYTYEFSSGSNTTSKQVLLSEKDDLWPQVRHLHIAEAIKEVTTGLRQISNKNTTGKLKNEKLTVAELSSVLKEMPQHQEQVKKYSLHVSMAERCMDIFDKKSLERIGMAEQDMVMGEDAQGVKIKNHVPNIVPIFQDSAISVTDKLRVLMLYIIYKNGIGQADRERLLNYAQIPSSDWCIVENLSKLGIQVTADGDKTKKKKVKRRDRSNEEKYSLSRWTPMVKDLMEDLVENKLDDDEYPSVREESGKGGSGSQPVASVRSTKPGWARTKEKKIGQEKESTVYKLDNLTGSRIIVFINGGMSYSEMRSAYEVTKDRQREVLIGSTSVYPPTGFLDELKTVHLGLDPAKADHFELALQ